MENSVLVIDDDQKLNELLKEYLLKYGFSVRAITNPLQAFREIDQHPPDIIILDVMLPDMDGFEVCKQLRKNYSIPIIMLTARGEVTDRIVGMELGADDYLPKPFEPRELVARLQSVLRRNRQTVFSQKIKIGSLEIDIDRQTVMLAGKRIELTTLEFEILVLFVKNAGKVLTRDRIMTVTHNLDWQAYNRTVDVLISRLRQKLKDDPKNPALIKTIWGRGYKFIGEDFEH